ncbi:hypothetical protein AN958_10703 [Leucoagaricus sp. SymC.cos]|nr:hypothetical protein AN958_10703 [Leucoagaricus sp. SymC.cos]
MIAMMEDKKAIIDGLDHITRDAMAVKSFTSPEATEVLGSAHRLSQEMTKLSNIVIDNKHNIPSMLYSAMSGDLKTIGTHAEAAGEAIINDCPAEKKSEAREVYAEIADALSNAVKAFSSS